MHLRWQATSRHTILPLAREARGTHKHDGPNVMGSKQGNVIDVIAGRLEISHHAIVRFRDVPNEQDLEASGYGPVRDRTF